MIYDTTLEEVWRIKREIGASFPTLEDYFNSVLADQKEAIARGVKTVSFAPNVPA